MSNTYRDKPSKRRKKVHAPLPPRPEKKEERKIWVGDEAVIEKHFLRLTRLLRDEEREERDRFKTDFLDRKPEEREKRGKALFRLELLETHYNPDRKSVV
jgi:hypothetical protein